uniref:Lg3 n=1 Tax=Arundo donax TaxID=35708 RepID=A0A0A9GR35_ARUDO
MRQLSDLIDFIPTDFLSILTRQMDHLHTPGPTTD